MRAILSVRGTAVWTRVWYHVWKVIISSDNQFRASITISVPPSLPAWVNISSHDRSDHGRAWLGSGLGRIRGSEIAIGRNTYAGAIGEICVAWLAKIYILSNALEVLVRLHWGWDRFIFSIQIDTLSRAVIAVQKLMFINCIKRLRDYHYQLLHGSKGCISNTVNF